MAYPIALLEKTRDHLSLKEIRSYTFINRKGFAPALICHDCHGSPDANTVTPDQPIIKEHINCVASTAGQLPARLPVPFPKSLNLHATGEGTERIEEVLGGVFPDTPIFRIDRGFYFTEHRCINSTRRSDKVTRAFW